MKKLLTGLAAVFIFGASIAAAAELIITHNPDVIAKLESGAYPNCRMGIPSVISGPVVWTCGPTKAGELICCQTG